MRTVLFIALLTCFAGAPAVAEPPSAALRLYAAGEFIAAAELADAQPSAASQALASRALVAACASAASSRDIDSLLTRAETDARQALALDPRSVDARLQLALVYGMEGRRASLARALTGRYASRGKHLIDEALALDPHDARAHAMLGAWHLEVMRRGGTAGGLFFGARTATGIAEFDRALRLAPDDLLIQTHFAVALLSLNATTYGARAQALLSSVLETPAQDALELLAHRTAERLQNALAQSPQAAQRAAQASLL